MGHYLAAVRRGDLTAIGAKECLRHHIESERQELEQLAEQLGLAREWEKICAWLALSVHALDCLKPEELQWHRDWMPASGALLARLHRLEDGLRRRPIRTRAELSGYLHWVTMKAVIVADAAPLLEQWHTQSSERERVQKLNKKLYREAERRRKSSQHTTTAQQVKQ